MFLLAIFVTGCGSRVAVDSRAKGPVTGRILVDGKPIQVEGVSLVLMPADQSAAVTIPVSKEGTFEGQAPLGKHYVSISAGHTPDAGHGEGPKVGFGPLFLSTESPLMITVAESATPQDLEVGNAAAKKTGTQSSPTRPRYDSPKPLTSFECRVLRTVRHTNTNSGEAFWYAIVFECVKHFKAPSGAC